MSTSNMGGVPGEPEARRRPTLIQACSLALQRIEEQDEVQCDNPILLELKKSILRAITELDLELHKDSGAPME